MAYVVREADLGIELDTIVGLMNANFPDPVDRTRFDWLYLANPFGRATAWFVVDDRTGTPVGSTVCLPRRVRLASGGEALGWLGGDFSILKSYRTMGVAAKLRRAAREAIDNGQADFLFSHPNDRMLAVHTHVGHQRLGLMQRYARPLRLRTGTRVLDEISARTMRAIDGVWMPRRRGLDSRWLDGAPGPEFTALFERANRYARTMVVRDAEFLRWRYVENPLEQAEFLTVFRSGVLVGYLVSTVNNDSATAKDWLATDTETAAALGASGTRAMHRRGLASLSTTVLEGHPDLPLLRRLGFRPRPDPTTAVAYAGGRLAVAEDVLSPGAWCMTVGDRDV